MIKYRLTIFVLGCMLLLSACANLQKPVPAAPAPGTGEKKIAMQANSYGFTPNNIKAVQGETLLFSITNVAGREHNFTIKNPEGKVLKSVDLPEHKTLPVTVTLTEPGTYEFYCDKPFHALLGMKGQVVAAAK